MKRPAELFDRECEWNDLVDFAEARPGTHLALVRGRRRQGKSYLLRRLADATGGLYYQAVAQERAQALAGIGAALGGYLEVPGGRVAIDSWDDVLRAFDELARRPGGALVIIDEFPYLLEHSPELSSLLQRFIDASREQSGSLRLILCGSALSVMASLLEGTQALRGRASTDVVVRAFDYRLAAEFWGIDDPATALLVHSVVGGTPGYRDLLAAPVPRRTRDVERWLAAGPLNPSSALFREDEYLLTEERAITDRAVYHSVVGAIAAGHTSQGAIAQALGRQPAAVQHPLRALVEAGFVVAADDALRARRPIYRIADPIVRFHHVVTRRDLARFEDRRTLDAWRDAEPRFRTHVLGPHFEELAREFTFRFASPDTVGGPVSEVGPAVVNDAAGRTQHEVDVVALGRNADGSTRVLALGEAKHTTTRRTLADLDRLEGVRAVVARKHPTAADARLLLFSSSGFDANLQRAGADRDDLELIDLQRLYTGT
jgi:AAA+ ATPase superfamily predicted ATPase